MTRIWTFHRAIAAASLAFATQALAETPMPDTATVTVAFADLNLATQAGRARLQTRIRLAATRLCRDPGDLSLRRSMESRACFLAALASAAPQLQSAFADTRPRRATGPALAMKTR